LILKIFKNALHDLRAVTVTIIVLMDVMTWFGRSLQMFWRNVMSPTLIDRRMDEGKWRHHIPQKGLIIYQTKKCHIPENSTLENT
jgi:hypothetical protein